MMGVIDSVFRGRGVRIATNCRSILPLTGMHLVLFRCSYPKGTEGVRTVVLYVFKDV